MNTTEVTETETIPSYEDSHTPRGISGAYGHGPIKSTGKNPALTVQNWGLHYTKATGYPDDTVVVDAWAALRLETGPGSCQEFEIFGPSCGIVITFNDANTAFDFSNAEIETFAATLLSEIVEELGGPVIFDDFNDPLTRPKYYPGTLLFESDAETFSRVWEVMKYSDGTFTKCVLREAGILQVSSNGVPIQVELRKRAQITLYVPYDNLDGFAPVPNQWNNPYAKGEMHVEASLYQRLKSA